MCLPDNSIELVTSTCPMCKVFKPTGPRCPHKRDVCRNKALHPRHDVVHFKNAEVQTFNNCGFCKWARTDPPANKAGFNNPGWPGCCRPPLPSEYSMIQPADWPAVSIVHKISIPPEVKALLAECLPSLKLPLFIPSTGSPVMRTPTSPAERKTLHSTGRTNSSPTTHTRSSSITIPQKGRSGGSPTMKSSTLVGSGSRSSGVQPGASPGPSSGDTPLRRIEGFRTTPPGTVRKLVEGDHATLHHPPVSRPSLVAAHIAFSANSAPAVETVQPTLKRRASSGSNRSVSRANSPPSTQSPHASNRSNKSDSPKSTTLKPDNLEVEVEMKALSIISDSSSDKSSRSSGSSAGSNSTITSEGGFTDYLSDESEAELQRQAEIRAAQLERDRLEEMEFRAARQQLASIGLRPPPGFLSDLPGSQPRTAIQATGGGSRGRLD